MSESSQFIGFIHPKGVSVSDTVYGPRFMDLPFYFLFNERDILSTLRRHRAPG